MESLGVYVCTEDLENELIRAVGASRVEAILEGECDRLRSVRYPSPPSPWGHR